MKIKILLIALLVLSFQSAWSSDQKDRDKKNDDKTQLMPPNPVEGVVYALPRTGIAVHLKLVKETFRPGPYAVYAEKYLGYSNVKMVAGDNWKISGIKVDCFGEADPDAVYKTFGPVASLVSLDPEGAISGVNCNQLVITDKVNGGDFISLSDLPPVIFPDQSSNDQYDIEVNSETGGEKFVLKTAEQKAREAADYLFKLRKKRAFTILSPSDAVPESGIGYDVLVKQIEKLEKEYTSLFLGKTFKSEYEYTLYYLPGNDNVKNDVLFRFSDEKGLLSKNDLSGRPVTIDVIKDQKQYSSIEKIYQPTEANAGRSGLFYRIPVTASLTILDGINTLYAGRFPVAQFGFIAPVPEMLLDGSVQIEYDRITGTIQSSVKTK